MNSFQTDENNEEILLSKDSHQVMMQWEKPYMEASIDFLKPKGFITEHDKREDGSFEVKYESYG